MKIRSVVRKIRAKLWKNVLSCNVEESFNEFLPGLDVDDVQNLISFPRPHMYLWQNFMNIRSSVCTWSW